MEMKTGFGFLRLPHLNGDKKNIDYSVLNAMVDRYFELGGNYFDTAYPYLDGVSEEAIRKAVVERYPRSRFRLANKLPGYQAKDLTTCRAYFEESLRRCGVDSFDVYLLHWLNEAHYAIAEKYDQFAFLRQLKEAGLARKIGFSYHDGPELLDRILTEHPEVDYVLLQINYLDWNSVSIQARRSYEVAAKHGKKVLVMEPVKGGTLASVPPQAEALLRALRPEESIPSWGIRFAADQEAVEIVLSGMNTLAQIEDNARLFPPLTAEEKEALEQCAQIIRANTKVGCTGCSYCTSHCPKGIPIPRYFALYNEYWQDVRHSFKMQHAYDALKKEQSAEACIGCHACEKNCPQKLEIPRLLADMVQVFTK